VSVAVAVAVLVAVAVPVAVLVAVAVPVAVLVAVALPVPVAVFVAVTLWLIVGCTDFDGEACGDVGTRLTLAGTELTVLPGAEWLAGELARADEDGGEIVVLGPLMAGGSLLADNSTATIAMMPIAAAPIPA